MAAMTKKQLVAQKKTEFEGMTQDALRDALVPMAHLKTNAKECEDYFKVGAEIFFARAEKKEGQVTVDLGPKFKLTRSSAVCVDLEADSFTQCRKPEINELRSKLNEVRASKAKVEEAIAAKVEAEKKELEGLEAYEEKILEDIEAAVRIREMMGDKFDHVESRVAYKLLVNKH